MGEILSAMIQGGTSRFSNAGNWFGSAGWGFLGVPLLLLLGSARQGPDTFYQIYLGGRALAPGMFQPVDSLIVQQPGYVNIYWLFQAMAR